MNADEYRGLRCNVCRTIIGFTTDDPVNVLSETNALCSDCYDRIPQRDDEPQINPYLSITQCPICGVWGDRNHAVDCPNA